MIVNIYLENSNKIISTEYIENIEISNIDDARTFAIKYLQFYNYDIFVKYNIEIIIDYINFSSILNIIFGKDVQLNRDFIINKVLE